MAETNDQSEIVDQPRAMATLEEVMALSKQYKQAAEQGIEYTCPETGMKFVFRRLTGSDTEKINSWAGEDQQKYQQLLAETASMTPKINLPFWAALGELSPIVRVSITMFVREISGMSDDAIEKAKAASKQLVA